MRFEVVTLFPDFFQGPLHYGVLQRALRESLVQVQLHDLRTFTTDRHRTVDDRPFGGGEGMVLKPEPLFQCVESLGVADRAVRDTSKESVVLLSAGGTRFKQAIARELASLERIVLICGRYEGVDQRVTEALCDRELSVGDYVLSGGELPAALIVDAVTRLLPGVLGHADSSLYESFGPADDDMAQRATGIPRATYGSGGLLDYPQYTRPALFRGMRIPEALASGDHQQVRHWRRTEALRRTLVNRPDLLETASLSPADQQILKTLRDAEES